MLIIDSPEGAVTFINHVFVSDYNLALLLLWLEFRGISEKALMANYHLNLSSYLDVFSLILLSY